VRGVPVGSIASVGVLQGEAQAVGGAGHDNQMHVVGHEAVTKQREVIEFAVSSQEIEIDSSFLVGRKEELPSVSALGDVVGKINCYDTG